MDTFDASSSILARIWFESRTAHLQGLVDSGLSALFIFTTNFTSYAFTGGNKATCNKCGFLIPNEHEEFEIKRRFDYKDRNHQCRKYNVPVFHDKKNKGFNAPIYPCSMCDGNPFEYMEG